MSRVDFLVRPKAETPYYIFLIPLFLQLLIFSTFDLGVDEAHYMLYARHLALSYFDHPPLIGWVHFIFNSALGENLFSARLPAMLAGAFSSWQLFLFLKEEGFSEEIAKWSTLAIGFCLQFFVLYLFFLPETLSLLLVWPLMRATLQVSKMPTIKNWLCLGLFLGLMGLSKYTAVFFLLPVAVVILSEQKLSVFKSTGFYLAVILALIIISPVLIWNAQNDWMSFRYQTSHVWGSDNGFKNFLRAMLAQVGFYGPFLFPFALIGFCDLAKQKTSAQKFMFWTCLVFAVFFFVSATKSSMLPHWTTLFYLFALPWGVARVLQTKPKWAKIPILANVSLIFVVTILLLTGIAFKIPMAFRDVTGWPEIMSKLSSREGSIAVTNWTYGSRALYYGKNIESKIFILDDHKGQFALWNKESPHDKSLWVLQFSYDEKNVNDLAHCNSLGEKEIIPIIARGAHQYDAYLQECKN